MGVPSSFDVDLSGNLGVGLGGGLAITGLPPLPAIHLNIDNLVPIHLNVDNLVPIHFNIDNLPAIHLSIDQIPKIQLGVDPVEIRLTQFPSIRGHLPADFCIGLSVLGFELMSVRLCGEAMVITEPYRANPCERCGTLDVIQIDVPVREQEPPP